MNNQICYNIWKVFYSVKTFALFLSFIPGIIIKNVIGVIAAIPIVDLLVISLVSILWFVLQVPLFIFAGLSKIPGVGFIFAAIGMPVAVLVNMIFNCLPSFARLRDPSDIDARLYWRKSIIVESYPFCIEFSQMDTQDQKCPQFYKILDFFKTQHPLNLFLTEFSTDKKEVIDSSPEKEEVTESGKIKEEFNNTSTQISKSVNDDTTKIIKDYFNSLTHEDFALTSSKMKPEEVRQMTNAIEGMQHKAKEQEDEEQFGFLVVVALGLILAVIALFVIGFTAY